MTRNRTLILLLIFSLGAPAGAGSRGKKKAAAAAESAEPAAEVDTEAILKRFEHGRHAEVFEREGVPCLGCHLMTADLAEGLQWEEEYSAAALRPGSLSCHHCHNNDNGASIAPGSCLLCHEPGQLGEDQDHGPWWVENHAGPARREFGRCRKCHQDYSCVECHERKDPTRWRTHDGVWRTTHGIDARIDPGRCETCHVGADCLACHTNRNGRWP